MRKPLIAITPGEPAGVGPDIVLQLAAEKALKDVAIVAIANRQLMEERARQLSLAVEIVDVSRDSLTQAKALDETLFDTNAQQASLAVLSIDNYHPVQAGQPNPANAAYLLQTLDTALSLCQQGSCSAMVTGPLSKHVINQGLKQQSDARFFSGHTEYLAEHTSTKKVVMMLAGFAEIAKNQQLRVALATTHLPLGQVAQAINAIELSQVLTILHSELREKCGVAKPRILVCGLNPHAGEQGDLGLEELSIINPLLQQLRSQGLDLSDALPADTLFTAKYLQQADAVLAMYHDQGLPVLKSHCFGKAANITLGLPIIRTSVDHGTAFDLAGTGQANTGSMLTAIDYATAMAASQSPLK